MEKVEKLIIKLEELKNKYHSVGFKNLTTGYLDRTGIVENKGEWIVNIGEIEGFGETLEQALESLINKMENSIEFKKALKVYGEDTKKVS